MHKFFTKKILITSTLLLFIFSSCTLFVVPFERLSAAGDSFTDVSYDFQSGHVVGKEYELLQERYIIQYYNSEELVMHTQLRETYAWSENKQKKELTIYNLTEKKAIGTKFRVCSVLVKTNYGQEQSSQKILAELIDDEGNVLPQKNSYGTVMPIDVSYLFENTYQLPNENWIFTPIPDVLKEL